MDDINALFVEARDEIEMAREEAETVYFNESVELARKATEEVLTRWAALLSGLPEAERGKMVRSMGMKIEQLKVSAGTWHSTQHASPCWF